MISVRDLRKKYIDFFQERGHKIVPSSSLVPKDDPTLLFTTAGMVQFKPMFAGTVDLEYTRAASIQKCLRTSDLENVGRTKRHMTFFEMLGNFSFGDYFKEEAIEFAWDFSVDVIGFDKDKIWISIYEDDDEAFEIWNKKIGVPAEKIVRLGKADNFWGPAGDTGACGPCSELYYDRGEEYGCGSDTCKPGCECERFMEYWNLVFNQYNQDEKGTLQTLPRTGIDTGMGLERLATLVQGVDSVYETDEMQTLIQFVCDQRNISYEGKNIVPINVIIEHARTITFAMSDGIYPSNDGRGYVLRRILRRALRFSRLLGIKEPFLHKLVDPLLEIMGEFYPELHDTAVNIKSVIESEEKRFLETIEKGMEKLEDTLASLKKEGASTFPGTDAFVLYDTFGFPLEMTEEIALEKGLKVDIASFDSEMEKQRSRGKESWKGSDNEGEIFESLSKECGDTLFLGYEKNEGLTSIKALATTEHSHRLNGGENGYIVLSETPFYGEAGGQTGDEGLIAGSDGSLFVVEDTKKVNKTIIHRGRVTRGSFSTGDSVTASINILRRNLIRANHTATHLLQAALKEVVGDHVKQAGSQVSPDRLRFDFSHFAPLSQDELRQVEDRVNQKIWENIEVTTRVMNINDAVKEGALAVFDEKYEETVRVITVEGFSKELCGGTHVFSTGEVGLFKVIKESSPGAGIRRIEAMTLKGVLDRYKEMEHLVQDMTDALNVAEQDLVHKALDLTASVKSMEKELAKAKKEQISTDLDSLILNADIINGTSIIVKELPDTDAETLRSLADDIRSKAPDSLILMGSPSGEKVTLLFAATKKAVEKGVHCGNLIKEAAKTTGGGGGGRPDMAQAGGRDSSKIRQALQGAFQQAKENLS